MKNMKNRKFVQIVLLDHSWYSKGSSTSKHIRDIPKKGYIHPQSSPLKI